MNVRTLMLTKIKCVLSLVATAGVAYAQGTPPTEHCTDFKDEKYWEKDSSDGKFLNVRYDRTFNGFPKAIVLPNKNDFQLSPVLDDKSIEETSFYRIAFALVHKPETIADMFRMHRNVKFKGSGEKWEIRVEPKPSPNRPDEPLASPLVLNQSTPGVYPPGKYPSGSANNSMAELAANKAHRYFLSPMVRGGDWNQLGQPLHITTHKNAPLLVARHIVSWTEKGVPLGFHDGSDNDGSTEKDDPKPCLVKMGELETPPDNDSAPARRYADGLAQAIAWRSMHALPTSQNDPQASPDLVQNQIDELTNGMVWLGMADYANFTGEHHCTGFFVAPQYIMTARHCVFTKYEKSNVTYDCKRSDRCHARGWLRRRGGENRLKAPDFQDLEVVIAGAVHGQFRKWIDYAVLRVPDADWKAAFKDRDKPRIFFLTNEGEKPLALAIPQYPNARALVISYDGHCGTRYAKETSEDNSDIKSKGTTQFRHLCDTAPKSSGSPVFKSDLSGVIGVHVNGWRRGDGKLVDEAMASWYGNGAEKISLIMEDLRFLKNNGNKEQKRAATDILDAQSKLVRLASGRWWTFDAGPNLTEAGDSHETDG